MQAKVPQNGDPSAQEQTSNQLQQLKNAPIPAENQNNESPKYSSSAERRKNSSSSASSISASDRSRSPSRSQSKSSAQRQIGVKKEDSKDQQIEEQQQKQTDGPKFNKDHVKASHSQHNIRYKYCCKKCKHADRDKEKKACVCVVPRDQRRTHLGAEGCQACGCAGCSKQDYIFRGQDPEYHPQQGQRDRQQKKDSNAAAQSFEARNGCCKNCMKAFSKTNRSCICQVPEDVRKTKLSDKGCKICGCNGCNPEDKKNQPASSSKGQQGHRSDTRRRSRSRSNDRQRSRRERRSRSRDNHNRKRSRSKSPEIIDTYTMNFQNVDRSIVGSMVINEYQIDPALLGFGIPQRCSSYIYGKSSAAPKNE